jgi:heme A synthase
MKLLEKIMKFLDITRLNKSTYASAALGIGVLLIIAGLCTSEKRTPPPWLTEWTGWAIDYVALVVAAGALVGVTKAVIESLRKP